MSLEPVPSAISERWGAPLTSRQANIHRTKTHTVNIELPIRPLLKYVSVGGPGENLNEYFSIKIARNQNQTMFKFTFVQS